MQTKNTTKSPAAQIEVATTDTTKPKKQTITNNEKPLLEAIARGNDEPVALVLVYSNPHFNADGSRSVKHPQGA